jgi:hypothetical protein
MPNPIAAKRLTELGCKVLYQKTHLLEPREIRTPEDLRPNTKKGKLDHKPIWVVEVQMPKKVAFDIYKGYMSKMKGEDKPENGPTESVNAPAQAQAAPMPPAGGAPGGMPPAGGAPGGMAGGGMPAGGAPV